MDGLVRVRRALISVSDKAGLVDLAHLLTEYQVEILSTGGTATYLREAGFTIYDVADVTGFGEMLDGRVKTLHPKIHGGLLAKRGNKAHETALQVHDIEKIDLIVVNLYPFENISKTDADYQSCVENIDIGGPAMVRSAAKNHAFVTVVCDREDYAALETELRQNSGKVSRDFRANMAGIAFGRTAAYDAAIATWFAKVQKTAYPRRKIIATKCVQSLRYGENPHQNAAFYRDVSAQASFADISQIQGKDLSYNNINDANAAIELIAEFSRAQNAVVAIIKHANPCGVAVAQTLQEAYRKALDADPISAFGGVVVTNRSIGREEAMAMCEIFTEIIIAPAISDEARAIFAQKPGVRLLLTDNLSTLLEDDKLVWPDHVRGILGGVLVQENDSIDDMQKNLETQTKRAPTQDELQDLMFAWRVVKHVKSNAIVCAKNGQITGIGAGQMSRIESVRLATKGAHVAGSVMASDAFFPFPDSVEAAAEKNVTAIIQPGGARRDDDVIHKADTCDIAMIFTNLRHFKH